LQVVTRPGAVAQYWRLVRCMRWQAGGHPHGTTPESLWRACSGLPVRWLLVLLGLTGLACDTPQPLSGVASQRAGATQLAALESSVHTLVNAHRQSVGLAPLAYSARLAEIARQHSKDMAADRVPMGHEGLEARVREAARTIRLSGIAENVGFNAHPDSATAQAAISWWLGSRGHRANIEGTYDLTGVGIARDARGTYYYTQLFLKTSVVSTRSRTPPD
jgi:uncharacterized protein YkwD